jgi:tRNA pseudouridine38-40 synthase
MTRYFIEVAYKGTAYAGFQIQNNSNTIQGEINKCLSTYLKENISTTTSSRTDAGVHALQNYLHADIEKTITIKDVYHLNAILPNDIVIKNITAMQPQAHSRFDALSRSYEYMIYQQKNPFLIDSAYLYVYPIDVTLLEQCANIFSGTHNFLAFSKRHTDVLNYNCHVLQSYWTQEKDYIAYHVEGNRFLRGMVRSLVATMLHVARGKLPIDQLKELLVQQDNKQAYFDVPAHGLHLQKVKYEKGIFL